MKLKWEKNRISVALANQGKIKGEDIIKRSRTDEFPAETATVRIQRLTDKVPHTVIHIRGKSKQRAYWNGGTYECAMTCRVNVGNNYDNCMSSNGDLDEDLTWQDVHNLVTEVKDSMGL